MKATTTQGPLSGAGLEGYEIHMGDTRAEGTPFCLLENGKTEGCCHGLVFGTYLHGLFDTGELTQKLTDWLCSRKGLTPQQSVPVNHAAYQQQQFDKLADGVRKALDLQAIYRLMEEYR